VIKALTILLAAALIALVAYVAVDRATSPSCSDRGGHTVSTWVIASHRTVEQCVGAR
jgi:hypothetical protein